MSLRDLIHDHVLSLGWRGVVLAGAALLSGWSAWRGRIGGILALPLTAAVLVQLAVWETLGARDDPELAAIATRVAEGIDHAMRVPIAAGWCALALLPAIRGFRASWRVALAGALWPLLSLVPRVDTWGWPYGGHLWAAAAMAVAGLCLVKRPPAEGLAGPMAYASFATLVAAASVPDALIVPFHAAGDPMTIRQRAGMCAVVAIGATPLALVPLWIEARRTGGTGPASGLTMGLIASALGVSVLAILGVTWTWW